MGLSAYLGVDCIASGSCRIRNSRIENKSIVEGNARIFGGVFRSTYLGGNVITAGDPSVGHSIITGASITGSPVVYNTITKDFAEIADYVGISGRHKTEPILIEGAAIVYGTCTLRGSFSVGGQTRIHEGCWERAPKHFQLGHANITECIDGKILLDCRCRPREYWLKHGRSLGRRFGWTEEQIDKTLVAIRLL